MMKKNWLPFALLITFILAWDVWVIRPQQKKLADAQAAAQAQQAPTSSAATTLPTGTTAAAPAVAHVASEDLEKGTFFSLAPQRKAKVSASGVLGQAEFSEYLVRGHKERLPVVILKNGLQWTSSDAEIAQCLASLKSAQPEQNGALRFDGKVAAKTCSVTYTPKQEKPGLVAVALTLSGFEAKAGATVEFQAVDEIGKGGRYDLNQLVYRIDGSKERIRSKFKPTVATGKVDWLSWGDNYFTTVLLPAGTYNPNVIVGAPAEGQASFGFQYPVFEKSEHPGTYELNVYFGTREPETLISIQPTLDQSIDLGFFAAIAKILVWCLKALNTVFKNYGVSIVVLTLLARLMFWPLNRKAYSSQIQLKALQPQMEKIKAKYGDDKSKAEQMNKEVLNLYKDNKVNPLGGCLPMLLQMPIFLGLYSALSHSMDLYQAPFFGWIHDLSFKDPYFVFPTLWTVTLLGYTKIAPAQPTQAGTPDMKWMMLAMNVFFGYLSKDWPSGLTLYLFVSNLVGITQQLVMQRAFKIHQPAQEGA